MNKLALAAAAATIMGVSAAHAQGPSISANIGLSTDYTFRGVSQTDESPAIQGGFDYTNTAGGMDYYAGVWASNVDLADSEIEMDLYAGLKPRLSDAIGFDVGVIGYFYPGAQDDGAELDYVEAYGKVAFTPTSNLTLGGALFVSPEFTGETGTGLYTELSAAYQVTPAVSISGAFGRQQVNDVPAAVEDAYLTWNAGVTFTPEMLGGIALDLRYVDTDIEADSFTGAEEIADERAVFSIKKTL